MVIESTSEDPEYAEPEPRPVGPEAMSKTGPHARTGNRGRSEGPVVDRQPVEVFVVCGGGGRADARPARNRIRAIQEGEGMAAFEGADRGVIRGRGDAEEAGRRGGEERQI